VTLWIVVAAVQLVHVAVPVGSPEVGAGIVVAVRRVAHETAVVPGDRARAHLHEVSCVGRTSVASDGGPLISSELTEDGSIRPAMRAEGRVAAQTLVALGLAEGLCARPRSIPSAVVRPSVMRDQRRWRCQWGRQRRRRSSVCARALFRSWCGCSKQPSTVVSAAHALQAVVAARPRLAALLASKQPPPPPRTAPTRRPA
jgi:hypothetical protein